ncbi:hypothetical protein ACFW6S_31805 [Streptomyces sp. NPDC058740]|uniref:hypothetical protein n=1 Tax=Streptomyces sp. NPDC058740 TaxID=3346619 RepID=UPI0036812C1B
MLEAIIAAVAGVLGAAMGSWATLRSARSTHRTTLEAARISPEPTEADVEVVDALYVLSDDIDPEERRTLVEREQRDHYGTWVVLDIKLRNRGGQTAYVSGLYLQLSDIVNGFRPVLPDVVHHLDQIGHELRMPPSYTYKTYLENESQRVRVSQVLPPGETERFLVSVDTPQSFFRTRLTVEYNAGRVAEARSELIFLRADPAWINAFSMLSALRSRMEQCGTVAGWRGQVMPTSDAGRLCLDEYERNLRNLAAIYAAVGRQSDTNGMAVRDSLARVPSMRQELGLDR